MHSTPKIQFFRQFAHLTGPLRKPRDGDAGYDLYSAEQVFLDGEVNQTVTTDLHIAIPPGYVGLIRDRSGHAYNHGVTVLGGVIDSSYRGVVKVILAKAGKGAADRTPHSHVLLPLGTRVAQLVVVPYLAADVEEVHDLALLGETSRGDGGFGSTGK